MAAVTPAKVPVLVVSPNTEDHIQLGSILRHDHWSLWHASTCEEAQAILYNVACSVVISESKLAGNCWRKILTAIAACPYDEKPKLIVTSSHADDRLWSEVLNLGGYNVLAKPFDVREVEWVLQNAIRDWTRVQDREPALAALA